MKYLAIDTSGDLIVIAVNGEKSRINYLKGCNTKHSVTLMPYVEQALNECDLKLCDLDFLAVVTGPGSFTGIRIGVSTVKALAFALNKPVLALTSFDLLAYSDNAPSKCVCLIDANHNNYYVARYQNKVLSQAPAFLSQDKILSELGDYEIAVNAPIGWHNATVCDIVKGLKNACETLYNNAGDLENVVPLYVKKSEAEENL